MQFGYHKICRGEGFQPSLQHCNRWKPPPRFTFDCKQPNCVIRFFIIVFVVLVVAALPFIVAGAWLEPWIEKYISGQDNALNPVVSVLLIIFILGSDILLPIPSSAVCTWAGKVLGPLGGSLACWLGLNIAAAVGYWLGRRFGTRALDRFADAETARCLEKLSGKSATACLVACRGLPIVAEASVLLLGMRKLPLREFWPPVLLANAGIAVALCALGAISEKYSFFPTALAISIAIPLLFIAWWTWRKP